MDMQPWQVITLPQIASTPEELRRCAEDFEFLGLTWQRGDDGLTTGTTVWGSKSNAIGIAWGWGEVRKDVVAISDPMTVLSNLHLMGEDGNPIEESGRLLTLHSILHELPWQRAVIRRIPDVAVALAA